MLPAWDKLWCHLWDLWKCPKHRAAWLQVSEKERKMWCWYFHFQISCGNNPKPPTCVCCLLSIEPRDGCRNIGCTAIFSQDLPESFPHSLAISAPSHLWLIRPSMQPMLQRGLNPTEGSLTVGYLLNKLLQDRAEVWFRLVSCWPSTSTALLSWAPVGCGVQSFCGAQIWRTLTKA